MVVSTEFLCLQSSVTEISIAPASKVRTYSYFIGLTGRTTQEGGLSRNRALEDLIVTRSCRKHLIERSSLWGKLKSGVRLIFECWLLKGERVFINYSALTSLTILSFLATTPLLAPYVAFMLARLSARNSVTLEVNDLPEEMAKDLDLPKNAHQRLDQKIFRDRHADFVFASSRMRDHAAKSYDIPASRTSVLINGGPTSPPNGLNSSERPKEDSKEAPLRFIYAGTLHRGRQVEEMVTVFLGTEHQVVLCGLGGEWLSSELLGCSNITYLGALPESEAHRVAADCDAGLIPYNSDLFYWQIAFPIKASFYITAGIPLISTPIPELMDHFEGVSALFLPLSSWRENLTAPGISETLASLRSGARALSHEYTWQPIFARWQSNQVLTGKELASRNQRDLLSS